MRSLQAALIATLLGLAVGSPAHAQDPGLNTLRWLGSHNSYRPDLDPAALARQRQVLGEYSVGVEYGHPPIADQLELGVRQLEFDPYADTSGGRFALPYANDAAKLATMSRPGAKVLHAPVVDARSLCLTLADCFAQVARWSDAHPGHQLLILFVNTKEDGFKTPLIPDPELFTEASLAALDADAVAAFGRNRLLTPDDVRGRAASLREAILTRGWPTARSAAGKVLLVLDSNPRIAELYRTGHQSLQGRVMFGLYGEAEPEAAVFNVQNPVTEQARIADLVARGFLVRTRADADTREARAGDLGRLEAAERSGAQVISTDYYPGAPDPLKLRFVVRPAFFR
jgi:hypothetical protein